MIKHDTLLVYSLVWEHRQDLREIFSGTYNLLEANTPQQFLLLLRQNIGCIAAVLIDVCNMDDLVIFTEQENVALLHQVPVIIMAEKDDLEIQDRAFRYGAADMIPLTYNPYSMLKRVGNIVDLHLHKKYLEEMVEEQRTMLRHTSNTMVDALSSIIEYRSLESGQHILRIRHFAKILLEEVARCCPEYRLDEETIAVICSASALHDIGKIAIPDAILMKPGALTYEEREIMKTHALVGCRILKTLGNVADREYLRYAHNICHYHHERWDGGGYPEGLKGDAIPICAQVVGLVDVYDALTTKRVYKDAYATSEAVNMILRGDCGVFSPKVLECFKHVIRNFENLALEYADGMEPGSESFDVSLPLPGGQESRSSVEQVHGKYLALAHYISGLLVELDFDSQIIHLVYNPYPELSSLEEMNTLEDAREIVFRNIVHPSHRDKMTWLLNEEIPRFLNERLRRSQYQFRIMSDDPEGTLCELTLMRIAPQDTSRGNMALLLRKVDDEIHFYEDKNKSHPHLQYTYRCRNDLDFTLVDLGRGERLLAGYTVDEIQEKFGGAILELIHPDDRQMILQEVSRQLQQCTEVKLQYRMRYKDGSVRWVYDFSRIQTDEKGREYLCGLLIDTNNLHRSNDILTEKLQRYEIILRQTENVLFDWDVKSDVVNFSDTCEQVFGYTPEGRTLQEITFCHPDDLPKLIDKINLLEKGSNYEMVELRMVTSMGRYIWCRLRATAIRDHRGALEKVCGIIINIDAEKQAEQALQNRAEQDSLTGLLNKNTARRQAEEYFDRYPNGVSSALLIIDLDNFKQVNDQYGHLFGDTVLTEVAREIKNLFRGQDIVARIGGDEFLVIMRGISDVELIRQRCQRLLQTLRHAFEHYRYNLPLSCSIGIALSPEHGRTYYELYQNADQALYRAKDNGKNCYVIYNSEDRGYIRQTEPAGALMTPIDSDTQLGMANDSLVRYAFQKLYSSRNVEESINEILSLIGQQMNVSRVYIFENAEDNLSCSNTYEWCNNGITPEMDSLQCVSYETDIPGYTNNFDENGIFYCPDVTILPKSIYEILEPQGIKSMLQCAIRENGVFRGYIGFDECREQRLWTKEQISMLTFLSESLSMFLLRMRRQEKVQQQADELRSILDNQDSWIYIVDPETFELKYVNGRRSRPLPNECCGNLCYYVLKGRKSPCVCCPAMKLGDATNARHMAYSKRLESHVLIEAARIRWEGKAACLMTCKALPDMEISDTCKNHSHFRQSETLTETSV